MLPGGSDLKEVPQSGQVTAKLLLNNIDVNDLPDSVFVCDVPDVVFRDAYSKVGFENLFLHLKPTKFIYLQNFRRVRVNFESSMDAAQARVELHKFDFKNQNIKIYFAQVQTDSENETSCSLLPPKPDKLFLISPPASPPVGWEPIPESEPVINYNLLSAVASLQPGESHELHPATGSTPSVVVHICEELDSSSNEPRLKIPQTRRPDIY